MNPARAAPRMITGNGTPNAKIATNEAAAIPIIVRFFRARDPMRITACTTMASTAALRPKNSPSSAPVSPQIA